MTRPSNPWVSRYRAVANIETIQRRTRVEAVPLLGLEALPIEIACAQMLRTLKHVHEPTKRSCSIILALTEMALAHAEDFYHDEVAVSARSYKEVLDTRIYVPMCLTGLNGVGKTEILAALMRALPADGSVTLDCSGDTFPLTAARLIEVKDIGGVPSLQSAIGGPAISAQKPGARTNACARWMYLRGACLLGLDEMQFLTQSEKANVLISQVLLAATYVGVPTVFACNYSLCHRLLKRPPETRDRLLARPEVLFPDLPDSEDWRNSLAALQRAVPGVFDFDFEEKAVGLWNFCAGRRRDLVDLLVKSYRRTRQSGCATVNWEVVVETFHSPVYFTSRQEVEALIRYALTGKCPDRNLVCPFQADGEAAYFEQLKAMRSRRVAGAANDSAMTQDERRAFTQIKQERSGDPVVPGSTRKQGGGRRRSASTTAAELSRNAKRVLGDEGPSR